MKALYYDRNGAPWDVVYVKDVAEPALAPGHVIVALEAAPLHIADLMAIRGELDLLAAGQHTPGFEGVGRIVAVSPDVADWQDGDRVFLPIGYGACQERRAVAAKDLVRAPEGIPSEQLALLPINWATAYLLLFAYVKLQPGDWVIQNAANSNVGSYVDTIALRTGMNVINVVRRPELIETLNAHGRAHVVVDGPDLPEHVSKITIQPPRLAFDAVGGDATMRLGQCVADGGQILSYGFLSRQPHALSFPDLIYRDIQLRGVLTDRALLRLSCTERAAMQAEQRAIMTSGDLSAEIAGVYPFSEVKKALRHAAQTGAGRKGKVVVVPD